MPVNPATRKAAAKAQKWRCFWCGGPMFAVVTVERTQVVTAEHIVPKSWGGGNGPDNIAAAHWGCNNRRGNDAPEVRALVALVVMGMRLPSNFMEVCMGAEPARPVIYDRAPDGSPVLRTVPDVRPHHREYALTAAARCSDMGEAADVTLARAEAFAMWLATGERKGA